ncbi:hypothetical protein P4O66_022443, partial [Electrophorus voltai]
MDEFDYSVHISEQDWQCFFQECEECDLLPPSLAGLEDSGMSDMDEVGSQRAWPDAKSRASDAELQIDGPPDCEGPPVELYLSRYGLTGPKHVLSGSEEDLHSETINVFFERLKGFSHCEDCMVQKHQWNVGRGTAGHLKEATEKSDITATPGNQPEPTLSSSSQVGWRKETTARDTCCSCRHNEPAAIEVDTWTCPDPRLLTNEEDRLQGTAKEGRKLRAVWKCGDRNQAICLKPDIEKTPSCALVSGSTDLVDTYMQKGADSQLVGNCSSECTEPGAGQGQGSPVTPRRKRKRKKRVSSEPTQPDRGQETPFRIRRGESEDNSCVRRCDVVREWRTSGDYSSGPVSEAVHTLSPPTDSVSCFLAEARLLSGDADISKSAAVYPNSPKADRKNLKFPGIANVAHTPRADVMCENGALTKEAAPAGESAVRAVSSSPECGVCNKEPAHMTLQSADSSSAPSSGDNGGTHLQLNSHTPSREEAAPKASEILPVFVTICDTERAASKTCAKKPAISENLPLHSEEWTEDKWSVLNHTASSSYANATALQQTAILPLGHAACARDSPRSQAGERLTSDSRDNTADQRKSVAIISCITFPELTEQSARSTCYNNAEKEEGLTHMSHDRVTPKHRNGHDSLSKDSLSRMCDCELEPQSDSQNMVKVQISPQRSEMKAFDDLMKSAQSSLNLPSDDTIKNAYSSESKTQMKQLESEMSAISNESVNDRLPLNFQNEDWTEEVCQFLRTKDKADLHASQEAQNMKEAESFSPRSRNDGLFTEEKTRECQSSVGDYKLETNPSIIITTSEEEKDQMQYVHMPPHFPSKENESTQESAAPTPESMHGVIDPEPVCPAATNQPTPPLYAMSSFWNEMEKLTINDILRLRMVGQAHPGILLQPEDSSTADTSDAADSGYFAHSDDSKPDRSSGDMALMSDFDEEFAQLQAQDSATLGEGSRQSPKPRAVMGDRQQGAAGTEDVFVGSFETALPPPPYGDSAQQCLRKMCKNVSVQNLQTYEAQPCGKILSNASLHSLHSVYSAHTTDSENQHDYEDPFDRVDTSSPIFLSDEEEDLGSPGITFSEIIQYLFGADEPERCTPVADNIAPSYLEGSGTSVAETYDQFFSEFEAESFFYPLACSGHDELVPIFSSSRSATRTHHFPEVYDYFFPDDSPVHSDEDEGQEQTSTWAATRCDHTATQSHDATAASRSYKDFFPESSYSWSFLWKNPLSLRKARHASYAEPPEGSSSWALTPVRKSGRASGGGIQAVPTVGLGDGPFQDPLLLGLENSIFRQLAQQQKICSEMQITVADPRVNASLMPLKQADMCLVCIAFASWVLKSVNPQGADTWKA